MIYNLSEIIEKTSIKPGPNLKEIQNAHNLVYNAVKENKIAVVQGPPGTGKTTVFRSVINTMLDSLDKNQRVIYIAPTNELVANMFENIVIDYKRMGKDEKDINKEIRVYGSKFNYEKCEKLNSKVDKDVKVIITTEYQLVFTEYQPYSEGSYFHVMIDEASRSPLHRPFITLSNSLLEALIYNKPSRIISFSVIGDPKQAIAIGEPYYEEKERLLIMSAVLKGLLKIEGAYEESEDISDQAFKQLKGRYFEFLDITKRLPSPSEKPISYGFYNGRLKAFESAEKRLQGLWNKNRANYLIANDEGLKDVVSYLETAITTSRPLIYVPVRSDYYKSQYDLLYDEKKANAGLKFAVALTAITGLTTTVITTYTDQWAQMKLLYNNSYRKFIENDLRLKIKFGTVHKMLGSEDENVVAILGKEYSSEDKDEQKTIHFKEPEILNVQLSRHKRIIVIVGSLSRLIYTAKKLHQKEGSTKYKGLIKTSEKILEQTGVELVKRRGYIEQRTSDGDEGVYAKIDSIT
jgi:hypothetical protein